MNGASVVPPAYDDPVLSFLADAPESDDTLTADELAAFDEGGREYRAGRTISAEAAKRLTLRAGAVIE